MINVLCFFVYFEKMVILWSEITLYYVFTFQISMSAACQVGTTATQKEPVPIQREASCVRAILATQATESHAQTSMSVQLKDITAMTMPPVQIMMGTLSALALLGTQGAVSPVMMLTSALPVI
jgi:hypothetical protein